MSRTLDTTAYLDTVLALLRGGERDVPVPVSGTSMAPFLHPGDTVYLNLPERSPKKGDIVLYTRPGGQYVLHRIVEVRADGTCLLLGDAQMTREPVAPDRICAVATAARRNGKLIDRKNPVWWFFRNPWRTLARWRPKIGKLAHRVKDRS